MNKMINVLWIGSTAVVVPAWYYENMSEYDSYSHTFWA